LSGLTLRNGNVAVGSGGAIFNLGSGLLTVTNSTITDNEVSGYGGGIASSSSAALTTLRNVTVSGNRADGEAGGLGAAANAQFDLNNVTVTANTADADNAGGGDGGGIFVSSNFFDLANSIVAGNTDASGGAPDCSSAAPVNTAGYNLLGTATGCNFMGTVGDIVGPTPLLGPLVVNGGSTSTHALLAGSPALNAANPAAPGSSATACATSDQRGTARPQEGRCDIGAFELVPASALPTAPPAAPKRCAGLKKKARKRCLCKQKKGKKRKKCLKKLMKGRKK